MVTKQSFRHLPSLSSKNFCYKMFLIIQKMYFWISKKVLIETFQFFFRWFGMHSEIVGRCSDPLTHSNIPILGSGSVCSVLERFDHESSTCYKFFFKSSASGCFQKPNIGLASIWPSSTWTDLSPSLFFVQEFHFLLVWHPCAWFGIKQ